MYRIIGADEREYGPVTAEQLRQWIAQGRANAKTRVRVEGSTDWKLLGELPEFSEQPTGAPISPAAPTLQTAPSVISAPSTISIPATPRTNPLAVTGLVLGILSLTIGCCCYGLPFNVAGVICSAIALSQINKDPINQQGKGMAIAGLVLSIFSILLIAILLIFGVGARWSEMLKRLNKM